MHRGAIALSLVIALAAPGRAQSADAYSRAFDRNDAEARAIVGHFECLVKHSRFAGQIGTGNDLVCARIKDAMVAVVVVWDVFGERLIFNAVDVHTGRLIQQPDTAEILTMLRAQTAAGSRALIDSRPDTTPLFPAIVYRADTVIHAWVIPSTIAPAPTGASTGGEYHYVMSGDGRRELSKAPVTPRRAVKGEVNGEWIIESRDSVPTVSELLMAHMLRMDSRPVSIIMPGRVAKLRGNASGGTWRFEPRKP